MVNKHDGFQMKDIAFMQNHNQQWETVCGCENNDGELIRGGGDDTMMMRVSNGHQWGLRVCVKMERDSEVDGGGVWIMHSY